VTLPELSSKATPEFVDAEACKTWLQHVPLANVAAAQRQIHDQLEEFNRLPTGAANRLAVMEALREAVSFVQIEQAKRFTNRALPMAEAETTAFKETNALWEEMRLGYARCLEAALNGDKAVRAQAALICQRLLAYSGLKMFHHYRAYREVPARDWRELHSAYAAAERLGAAEEEVKDFLNRDVHDSSPRIQYARALLTGIANPNELGPRQLTFVAFLLERWGSKLEIHPKPVPDEAPPLVVDLAGERPPERIGDGEAPRAAEPRYLDTRKIAKSLRNRVGLLRKGESPAKLALGEDCVQPTCEQLLVFLYRQWCQGKPARDAERKSRADKAQACNEFAAIHYYVTGRGFRQPGGPSGDRPLTQQQQQELETLGRVMTKRDEADYSDAHGFVIEEWRLEDESAQGLRMVRPAGSSGKRYAHGQLVAVRPADAKSFLLGQVRWLMGADNGDVHAGVKLLPGLPSGAAVRATGLNVQSDKYLPALALSAVAALNSPASLVLPAGWFKPKRVIEVYTRSLQRVALTEVIERGSDFERVAYEPAA
jgi:cyclic-di-GMP-binding protein